MASKDHTYRSAGNKTGVLLVHGLCGTPTEMRYVANGLARAGYTVLCPQLAGHCGSAEDIKNTSWQDWYKSCEAGLDELRQTCDTVIVGGLSTGALLALVLAAEHPDKVQGVTLYAPVLWLNGWLIPWYARLFRIIGNKTIANMIPFPDLHPHGIKDDRIREFILSALNSGDSSVAGLPCTPGGAVLEHRWLSDTVRRLVPSIKQPVLILHPREDDYAQSAGLGRDGRAGRQLPHHHRRSSARRGRRKVGELRRRCVASARQARPQASPGRRKGCCSGPYGPGLQASHGRLILSTIRHSSALEWRMVPKHDKTSLLCSTLCPSRAGGK
jgi:carboxylesterase